MTKEQPQYLILKLRSGDEIIGKRNGTKKGFVLLHRPLQLHRSTLLDPTTGAVRKNICMLRDWLEFTTQIECEIPEDYIVISNPPSPDMIEKYVQELVSFDVDAPQPVVAPIATTPPKATPRKAPLPPPALTDDMLDDFFKNILQQKPNSPSAPPAAPFMGGFASTPIPPSPAPVIWRHARNRPRPASFARPCIRPPAVAPAPAPQSKPHAPGPAAAWTAG